MAAEKRAGERGLSLLEVLVALVILATVAVTLLRLLGESAGAAVHAGSLRLRAELADALWQSVRLGVRDPGILDAMLPEGYRWQIEERPFEEEAPARGLVRVRIRVEDGEGRSFVLESVRRKGS